MESVETPKGFSAYGLFIRNEYYNSKEGRLHDAQAADEATQGGSVRG